MRTKSRTEVEHDDGHRAGIAGLKTSYELSPNQGAEPASHVGQQVLVTAVAPDAKKGDDDAKVTIEDETKVDRDNAPDSKVKTRTEADLPRSDHSKVTVLSVKTVAPSCRR